MNTMIKEDYIEDFSNRVLAGEDITLLDVMLYLCPGDWRVEIYTEDGYFGGPNHKYRGFFRFFSEEFPPTYGSDGRPEPYLDCNDRDCGIRLDLDQNVKIIDNYLLYESSVGPYNSKKEIFKLYFIEDKPLSFRSSLMNVTSKMNLGT